MKKVVIIGSGIAGVTIAHELTKRGHVVEMFEIGDDYPYPFRAQYETAVLMNDQRREDRCDGARRVVQTGDYRPSLDRDDRAMRVGGSATLWWGITPRFLPSTFRPKTLHGYGDDWPIAYEDLEPFYERAEAQLGVSGSADDNPFAAPRRGPYPLPPFELGYVERILAEKLKAHGLAAHTTPQARTRLPYDGRPACENYGTCWAYCPTGAIYSPGHHLARALATGLLTLHTRAAVTRLVTEGDRVRAIVYHPDRGRAEVEHAADVVVVAMGGIESTRLLLLSRGPGHPEGIGNAGGRVGQNLTFHAVRRGFIHFREPMFSGRFTPCQIRSDQFNDPPGPRRHGGMSFEIKDGHSVSWVPHVPEPAARTWKNGAEVLDAMRHQIRCRDLTWHCESDATDEKYIGLSDERDPFGDPFARVHYVQSEFDRATYEVAKGLVARIAEAVGAESAAVDDFGAYWSAGHHMGACRMGRGPADSVVDSFGEVHGVKNLFVAGAATFVTATPFQPTLTITALSLRTADYIRDRRLS
jgi:choline dehydrogenase-like flavoprotein